MTASIIIITKNQKPLLQRTLPTLLEQNFKDKIEIIVVDSGSSDGAVEYVKSLPVTLVKIKPQDFNYAYAFNSGCRQAKGEFLIRLSGDCIPLKNDFVKELLMPFADPKVGATYGKYQTSGNPGTTHSPFWPSKRFPTNLTRYSIKITRFTGWSLNTSKRNYAFNLAGGCCAIRKKVWDLKHFDEIFPEGEDAEYAWFLHLIGYDIVYNPKAVALHDHQIINGFGKKLKKFISIMGSNYHITKRTQGYWIKRMFGSDPYKEISIN